MSDEAANNLAVKIARLLQSETREVDLYSLQKSIEKISERLEKIETTLSNQNSSEIHPSSFILHRAKHPSQEKFDIAEIIADGAVEISEQEKPCPYEPTGNPCDHCSMCNSRGF
jgi:chromosome condensin MukBEF complex kleisin-like MukF subunit